jgi:starch synthase
MQLGLWRRWRRVFAKIIGNSDALALRLARGGLVVDGVIRNGTPILDARPRLPAEPVVAYVGRIAGRKGIAVLIRAMRIAVDAVPGARLVVAGGGPDLDAVRELTASLGLGGHVEFLGHQSRDGIAKVRERAWITAVPTIVHESFSNTAIESMMRGTGVVATRVGGFPEMIEEGVTGHLVERDDAADLARVLIACLNDREHCEVLGANARRHALAELSDDVMVDRFLSLYEEIAAHSSRRPDRIRSVIPHTT